MAVANGFGKVTMSGSVFMYDTGDTINSYRGEPTTNVFKHYGTSGPGSASDNAVNFENQGTTGFVRLGYGQTFGGYTIQPNDVVYKYPLGGYGCHYHGNSVTIPSGKYATFSFDYYVSPGTTIENSYLANFENYGGSALGGGVSAPNSLTGVWQTVTLTLGPTGGSGTQAMFLYPGGCGDRFGDIGYILYKNPQVEFLPHKTQFTQTSRSVSGSLLPLVGNSSIDLSNVSFDSAAQITFDGTDDYFDIATNFSTVSQYTIEYVAYKGAEGKMPIAGRTNASFYKFGDYSWAYTHGGIFDEFYHEQSPAISGYIHCVITYDGSFVRVWRNGYYAGAKASSGTADFSNGFKVGYWSAGGNYAWTGPIPIVKIYNRALSSSEVQQNYNKYKTRFNLP
jgi:hypothetical protein